MTDTSYNPNFAPYPSWSVRQAPVPATVHNVPSSVAANGSVNSSLIVTEGFTLISAGVTASQAGTMSIQRYLDAGGTVPQGSASQVSLSANTAANLNVTDGLPFASFKLTITNSAGSTSNLTNFALLLQVADATGGSGGGGGSVTISGTLPAFASTPAVSVSNFPSTQPVSLTGNSATDGSTTITTGGTAQNLFGGTTPANGFAIYNPDLSNDLWVSDSATAAANGQGSIRVAANGGGYETPGGYKPLGAVSIIGASTGQKITARRW